MSKKRKKKENFETFRTDQLSPYKSIKTTLKSVLKDFANKTQILNLVHDINYLVIHVYQFIRLYLLFIYNNKLNFPDINEAFIMSCIKTLGIRDNRGAKSKDLELLTVLNDFYEKEYKPLFEHEKISLINKTYILPYISTQVYTNITVNIQEHFIQHLLRFINLTTEYITNDKTILFNFKKQFLELEITDPIFEEWIKEHKVLPDNIEKSVYYDIKIRPLKYLKCMFYMNSVLEQIEENDNTAKLFQVSPLRSSIIPKHVLIDSASLISLFCPVDCKKGELLKNISNNQELIWSSFLRTNSKIFKNKNYEFHNQIQTDGISCSLLFIRKDLANKKWSTKVDKIQEQQFHNIEDLTKEQLSSLKNRNVVGCDPGKRSLVYMVDQNGNKLQYTSPQRMCESKSKRNKFILEKEKKKFGITDLETELSTENSKTINYEKFKKYLIKKDKLNKDTEQFYESEKWRKMAFRTYAYSQKSVDKFLNKISEVFGPNVVIGYGNWSRQTQMKFYESTMNRGLRLLIHKRYDTLTINEHNTTKKCCECHKDLVHHRDSKNKEIFRLLRCNSCESCNSSNCVSAEHKKIVFRTRDVNAAINIRNITSLWIKEQRRLPVFSRHNFEDSSFTSKEEKVGQSEAPGLGPKAY